MAKLLGKQRMFGISHPCCGWLRRGEKENGGKETEGLITAAQDQTLRTNLTKAEID